MLPGHHIRSISSHTQEAGMTKMAFTVEIDPSSVSKLLRDPVPGISVIPPRVPGIQTRSEHLGFLCNVEVKLVIDLSLSTVVGVVAYLIGRLQGSRNAKLHLNQRAISIDNPELIKSELNKLAQHNQQYDLPKQS